MFAGDFGADENKTDKIDGEATRQAKSGLVYVQDHLYLVGNLTPI